MILLQFSLHYQPVYVHTPTSPTILPWSTDVEKPREHMFEAVLI